MECSMLGPASIKSRHTYFAIERSNIFFTPLVTFYARRLALCAKLDLQKST